MRLHTTRLGLALLAALTLLGLDPAAASAQQPEIPAEVRARGRRLQEEAAAHVDAQRWALAADAYRQIYELGREYGVPQAPIALWDMGLALMRIPGREAEARDAFQRFLDESTTLTEDAQVRDWRSTALEHIAELEARIGGEHGERNQGGSVDEASTAAPPVPSAPTAAVARDTMSPIGPITLSVGGAALLAGAIIGAISVAQADSFTSRCSDLSACPPDLQPQYDEMRAFSAVADVLFVSGGLIAFTGFVLALSLREGRASTSVSATCGLVGCTAALTGRW